MLDEKAKSKKCEMLSTWKMQDYLVTDRLSLSEKHLLYSLRVSMVAVRNNYRSQYGENLNCQLCNNHLDNQENLLKCSEITSEVSTNGTIYNDMVHLISKLTQLKFGNKF